MTKLFKSGFKITSNLPRISQTTIDYTYMYTICVEAHGLKQNTNFNLLILHSSTIFKLILISLK